MSKIVIKAGKVHLDNVILDDPVIVSAFDGAQQQGQDLDRFLRDALHMGILVSNTAADKSKIEELGASIKQLISEEAKKKTTDADNATMRLEELIKTFQTATKTNAENTDKLEAMFHKADKATAVSVADPTQAGRDYEQVIGDMLKEIASHHDAAFRFVGNEEGKHGKTGDYIIDFDEGLVVFEIKKRKSKRFSMSDIRDEISRAVENRGAQYGVFLVNDAANLPDDIRTAGVIEKDLYMACAMEEDGKPLPEIFLRMICTMARLRIKARTLPSTTLAVLEIQRSYKEAQEALKTAHQNCKAIQDTASRMEDKALGAIARSLESILAATKRSTNTP